MHNTIGRLNEELICLASLHIKLLKTASFETLLAYIEFIAYSQRMQLFQLYLRSKDNYSHSCEPKQWICKCVYFFMYNIFNNLLSNISLFKPCLWQYICDKIRAYAVHSETLLAFCHHVPQFQKLQCGNFCCSHCFVHYQCHGVFPDYPHSQVNHNITGTVSKIFFKMFVKFDAFQEGFHCSGVFSTVY